MTFTLDAIGVGWWHLFCLNYLIIYFAYIIIINRIFWIVWQKLLNAHFITNIAVVFIVNITMTFAFEMIEVNWWYLFCLRHLITHFIYVEIVTMALIFSTVRIDR